MKVKVFVQILPASAGNLVPYTSAEKNYIAIPIFYLDFFFSFSN